jgi:hypothetical protein
MQPFYIPTLIMLLYLNKLFWIHLFQMFYIPLSSKCVQCNLCTGKILQMYVLSKVPFLWSLYSSNTGHLHTGNIVLEGNACRWAYNKLTTNLSRNIISTIPELTVNQLTNQHHDHAQSLSNTIILEFPTLSESLLFTTTNLWYLFLILAIEPLSIFFYL